MAPTTRKRQASAPLNLSDSSDEESSDSDSEESSDSDSEESSDSDSEESSDGDSEESAHSEESSDRDSEESAHSEDRGVTSGGDEDEESEFEPDSDCPVCFIQFVQPKILKCGHTVCEDCAGKMIERSLITCPLCQMKMRARTAGDLATNYALKNLIEKTAEMNKQHAAQRAMWVGNVVGDIAVDVVGNVVGSLQYAPRDFTVANCQSCQRPFADPETYACLNGPCTLEHGYAEPLEDGSTVEAFIYSQRIVKKMCPRCICLHHLDHDVVDCKEVADNGQMRSGILSLRNRKRRMDKRLEGVIALKMVAEDLNQRFKDDFNTLTNPEKAFTTDQFTEKTKKIEGLLDETEQFLDTRDYEAAELVLQAEMLAKYKRSARSR